MTNPAARQLGNYCWCIQLANAEQTEVYAYAAEATTENGSLQLWATQGDERVLTMAFAPGQWVHAYLAPGPDGIPAAAVTWPGVIA